MIPCNDFNSVRAYSLLGRGIRADGLVGELAEDVGNVVDGSR